jgi:hypothetical protein
LPKHEKVGFINQQQIAILSENFSSLGKLCHKLQFSTKIGHQSRELFFVIIDKNIGGSADRDFVFRRTSQKNGGDSEYDERFAKAPRKLCEDIFV